MSTILFNEIVFGPLHSRRLGVSLGINLLPYNGKLCSFDCIYCECGYNENFRTKTKVPEREMVKAALEDKLIKLQTENVTPDVITFAGNGEPTMHAKFAEVIDDTIELRNKYFPQAKVCVLTNAMHLNKKSVVDALKKIDYSILKLDSANDETARLIDRPVSPAYSIARQLELFKQFDGKFVIQTMFVRGTHRGKIVDNATEEEITAWLKVIEQAQPSQVMIYTIDRETPEKNLEKVSLSELNEIGKRVEALGISVSVSG